jgi:hypothetical protein
VVAASSRSSRRQEKAKEVNIEKETEKERESSEEGELSEGEIVASHADLAQAAAKKAAATAGVRFLSC